MDDCDNNEQNVEGDDDADQNFIFLDAVHVRLDFLFVNNSSWKRSLSDVFLQ